MNGSGEDIYSLLPLLRRLPLNFISSYEQQNNLQKDGNNVSIPLPVLCWVVQSRISEGSSIHCGSDGRLVYGSRSEDIATVAAFEERWGDLTLWSCDSVHFQLEILEYGVSKTIAERYHPATAATILIPKT
jgi:hypothetical protein